MSEIADNSIDLIVTSPPYFNVKDYSKDGYQNEKHSEKNNSDIGGLQSYSDYVNSMLEV